MLVNITDQLTDRRYLVDTGASYCLVPHKSTKPPAKEPRLIGPNGSLIRCWGEERRRLRFSGRTFEWTFLQADVAFPILGVDFLRNNKLMVDVASNTLVDSTTGDTFALSELPSGYTASVVLPGGVRGAKATPPGVVHQPSRREPAPQGAEREAASSPTYAAAAAAAAPRSLPTRKATPPGVVHQPPRRQAAPPGAVHKRTAAAVPGSISAPADAKRRSRGNQQTPTSSPAADVAFPIRGVDFLHQPEGDRPPTQGGAQEGRSSGPTEHLHPRRRQDAQPGQPAGDRPPHPGRCTRGPQRPHGASPPLPTPRCAAGATNQPPPDA